MGIGHLMELGKDEAVQERVLEVVRQFFSNSNITVNLLPALIIGGLLLLGLPLLLLFFPGLLGGGSTDATGRGYGAPSFRRCLWLDCHHQGQCQSVMMTMVMIVFNDGWQGQRAGCCSSPMVRSHSLPCWGRGKPGS